MVLALTVAGCGGNSGGGGTTGPVATPTPVVSVTGPTIDLLPLSTDAISLQVTGKSLLAGSQIRIEGGPSVVQVPVAADRTFLAQVPLNPNKLNSLFAKEVFSDGSESPAHPIKITQDSQPPKLWIDFPPADSQLSQQQINVSGRVADGLSGFQGLEVLVDNKPAIVNIGIGTNGTFDLAGFKLKSGSATNIEVRARDTLGNETIQSVQVEYIAPTGSVLKTKAGAGQSAKIGTLLDKPLEVEIRRPDGTPYVGKIVRFEVVKSDGRLSADGQAEGTLDLSVPTDSQGIARVHWKLGSEAGCGNNRVRVTSNDIAGTAYFCASADPDQPIQINLGSGNNQTCQAPGPAGEPLRVWVNDGCNPGSNVTVEFRVLQGDGLVAGIDGVLGTTATVLSGPTGHAEVRFEFGPEGGTNRVEASFADNQTRPVVFALYGRTPDLVATCFTGLVSDSALQPIGGLRVRLEGLDGTELTGVTDEFGRFRIDGIPFTGPTDLYIDGVTAALVGGLPIDPLKVRFPDMHYEPVVLPKTENTLAMSILLPDLDPINDVLYDGSQDITLRVNGVEGLEMRIKAGSMTLVDGSHPTPEAPLDVPIRVALNQVHHDDVPMPMPDGVAPSFAWTLQPAGAHFDPPVQIQYPNMAGLPAGAAAYFLSFDHDTSRFEIVSSGSVTPDARYVVSDPNSGLTVAGWGCNCPPYAVTGDCKKCDPEPNGCGPAFLGGGGILTDCFVAVQSPFFFCFTNSCNQHDICYSSCGAQKSTCDLDFLANMAAQCQQAYGSGFVFDSCLGWAYIYYKLVDQFGSKPYKDAQSALAANECCLESTLALESKSLGDEPPCPFVDTDGDLLPDEWETLVGLSVGESDDTFGDPDFDGLFNVFEYINGLNPFDADTDRDGIDDLSEVQEVQTPAVPTLSSTWVATVNGQSVHVADNGLFRIDNVSAPDNFGPAGPGSAPDFKSDDPLRLTAVGQVGNETWYAYSAPFQLTQGQTFPLSALVLTKTPPPIPKSLSIQFTNSVIEVGMTGSAITMAKLADGSEINVSTAKEWTSYDTSDFSVATVDQNGTIVATGKGSAFITAKNGGATAVRSLTVVEPNPPKTTVVGFVELPDGTPVSGANVKILGQGLSMTTAADGYFAIGQVITSLGPISVIANATIDDLPMSGSSGGLVGIPDGFTDAGLIRLEPASSSGKDFLLAFPRNNSGGTQLRVFIASEVPTAGQLDIAGLSFTQAFTVTPGVVTTIDLPASTEVSVSGQISNKGIRISAESDICVYGLNQLQFTTDAYSAYPIESFGTEYRILTYNGSDQQLTIVASEPETTVIIQPEGAYDGIPAGGSQTVVLDANQVYYLIGSGLATGCLVTSDKPIGVFGGNACTNVPSGASACDHLIEMFPPLVTWGQSALTVDLAERSGPDTFRILAAEDGTDVTIAGTTPATFSLDAGEFRELLLDGLNQITANGPIGVCQYSNGKTFDNTLGDPFMMVIPPAAQFQKSYTFATPPTGFASHWVNVVAPASVANTGQVLLDGAAIPAGEFQPIGTSGFRGAQVSIGAGSHTLSAPEPTGITVYGFNNFDSYGYPGGMALGTLGQ